MARRKRDGSGLRRGAISRERVKSDDVYLANRVEDRVGGWDGSLRERSPQPRTPLFIFTHCSRAATFGRPPPFHVSLSLHVRRGWLAPRRSWYHRDRWSRAQRAYSFRIKIPGRNERLLSARRVDNFTASRGRRTGHVVDGLSSGRVALRTDTPFATQR